MYLKFNINKKKILKLGCNKKAQFAMEYLLVIGLLTLLIIPGIYMYYNYSVSSLTEINLAKVQDIGNGIISNAESAYYLGRGSRITLDISMPSGVKGLSVKCANVDESNYCELNFDMGSNKLEASEASTNEVSFSTKVPIKIKIMSEEGVVTYPTHPEGFNEEHYSPGKKKVILTVGTDFVNIEIN